MVRLLLYHFNNFVVKIFFAKNFFACFIMMFEKYVFKTVAAMVEDIASGNVSPNPYTRGTSHNACAFCAYGSICHDATVTGRRNYKAMPAEKFWEEVGKEMR